MQLKLSPSLIVAYDLRRVGRAGADNGLLDQLSLLSALLGPLVFMH